MLPSSVDDGADARLEVYRHEAIGHAREFIDLGLSRSRIAQLNDMLRTRERCVNFLDWARAQEMAVARLVCLGPVERRATLGDEDGGSRVTRLGLVLAGYQYCRRAVLAYDWLRTRPRRPTPTLGYREATVTAAMLFARMPRRVWRMWPPQWGASPFINDQYYVGDLEADYILGLDDHDPWPRTAGDAGAGEVAPPWEGGDTSSPD
ncbi:MAG TPA: hypothetical protein VMU33_15670 [Burkholderiaceae bacterium]|nr:hypothetical protein [Burkholderiaceae bacterium]